MPLLAGLTAAFVHPIFHHFYRWRWRHVDELALTRQTDPGEIVVTIRTRSDEVLLDLGWSLTIFAVSSQKVFKLLKEHEDPSQVCLKKRDDRPIPGITPDVFLAHAS